MGSSASSYDDLANEHYHTARGQLQVMAGKHSIPTSITGGGNGRHVMASAAQKLPVTLKGPKTEFLMLPEGTGFTSQVVFRVPSLAVVFELALQTKTGDDLLILRMTFAEKVVETLTWRAVATQNPPLIISVCSPYNAARLYNAEVVERAEEYQVLMDSRTVVTSHKNSQCFKWARRVIARSPAGGTELRELRILTNSSKVSNLPDSVQEKLESMDVPDEVSDKVQQITEFGKQNSSKDLSSTAVLFGPMT